MNAYVQRVFDDLCARNAHEKEFIQAASEILESLSPVFDKHPEYEKAGLLERFGVYPRCTQRIAPVHQIHLLA